MTEYKKEEPKVKVLKFEEIESDLESSFAMALSHMNGILNANDSIIMDEKLNRIKHYMLKAWNLVPEESAPLTNEGTKNEK